MKSKSSIDILDLVTRTSDTHMYTSRKKNRKYLGTTYSLNKACPKGSALVVVITHIFYSYGPLRSGKISVIDKSLSLQISIRKIL